MTKQELITKIAIQRSINGSSVKDAKISVYDYRRKMAADLRAILQKEYDITNAAKEALTEVPEPVDPRDAEIAELTRRIDRLEAFLATGQDTYTVSGDLLIESNLTDYIVDTVRGRLYITTNSNLNLR